MDLKDFDGRNNIKVVYDMAGELAWFYYEPKQRLVVL